MKATARQYLRDAADIFAATDKFETPTEPTRASPWAALLFLILTTLLAIAIGALLVPALFALIASEASHL